MRFKNLIYLALVTTLIVLSGCSQSNKFEPDAFSKDDLAIIKEDNPKFKLSYGMSRVDVEKLLGEAREDSINSKIADYDFGVKIMYREDVVAGVMLSEDSKGIYQTARGASVGMTKEQIKELYGSKYALDEHNVNYIYDSKNDRFMESLQGSNKEPEELEQTFLISAMIVDGESNNITLSDGRMATRLD